MSTSNSEYTTGRYDRQARGSRYQVINLKTRSEIYRLFYVPYIKKAITERSGESIFDGDYIDLGAGTGAKTQYIYTLCRGTTYILDGSEKMLVKAKKLLSKANEIEFSLSNILDIDITNHTKNKSLVTINQVLHHIDPLERKKLLQKIFEQQENESILSIVDGMMPTDKLGRIIFKAFVRAYKIRYNRDDYYVQRGYQDYINTLEEVGYTIDHGNSKEFKLFGSIPFSSQIIAYKTSENR